MLAEGSYVSRSTAAFQTGYCAPYGATDPICGIASFTWTVHGLMPGPGVLLPYDPGTGVALSWSRYAGYYDRFFGLVPSAEFYRGVVPAADTATRRELHVTRARCCYLIPWGTTAAWETYEGVWRFGAVPDDGGQAELGVPAVLRLRGPRTDAPQAVPADFTVETSSGDSIVTTRWWYVRPANNSFDGERVDSVATGTQYPPYVPRYPDARRAAFTELAACLGRRTCAYQATSAGALVVQATLTDGRVLAARNTGASGAHVKITADTTTLTYGDTTVFRVTAAGASQWSVTGYSFRPVGAVLASAMQAVRGPVALRGARSAKAISPEGGRVVRGRTTAQFRDAALACGEATIKLCYDFPPQTGYEIVTAVVDGEAQRDSVLVTVVPLVVIERAGGPNRNGSFLAMKNTAEGTENVITLRATVVTPAAFADSVTWSVVGMALQDTFSTIAPDTVRRGAVTRFVVPPANVNPGRVISRLRIPQRWANDSIILPGRWPVVHDKGLPIAPKVLAFRITAMVNANGQSARSAPVTVRQDEIDVLRQEYVDFGMRWLPARSDAGREGNGLRNVTGDYSVWLSEPRLLEKMPVMQALAMRNLRFSPVVMSGFRNPVHHFIHANAHSRDSQHLHGDATDWAIEGDSIRPTVYDKEEWFTELFKLTRDPSVDGCWEPARVIRKTNLPSHTLNHAHSDWRDMSLCSDAWRTER